MTITFNLTLYIKYSLFIGCKIEWLCPKYLKITSGTVDIDVGQIFCQLLNATAIF